METCFVGLPDSSYRFRGCKKPGIWNDTYLPITDPNNVEASLPKRRWNEAMIGSEISMRRPFRLQPTSFALIFVSLSDLTQDQRQVLTSLMAHRNRVLADYSREVYLEIFRTTKTSVDNPLLAPSGHGGRKTFLVIDEGYLDNHEGYWVEDEEDGAEGFLEADEDAFWVYDEENYTWFQRRFQGRKMKRGFKGGLRKGKGKGGKGPEKDASSRRGKAGRILPMIRQTLGKPKDNGRTVNGKINHGMTGPGTSPRKLTQPKEKERKVRRAKEKASLERMERTGSPASRVEQPSLQMLPRAVLQLLQHSTLTT